MRLLTRLHALLFATNQPSSLADLAEATQATESEVVDALGELCSQLELEGPVQLVQIAGGYQLCTKPEHAEMIAKFLKPQRSRLSRSQLEVLAIVAYKQPVTSAEIDHIRGVQSDYGLRALVDRRLVVEVGRKKTPGRPLLYGTSHQFLHQFGLENLETLPQLALVNTEAPEPVESSGPA